ncbi:MAG: DnaD domain protein [Oscillospiraceae bacterium]|nr:DnaD domain protein [Oscillospiraceae bacterium]
MGEYLLHLRQEENITIGSDAVRRLVEYGSSDAALLYLCLARHGASQPEKLRAELRWDAARFSAAEKALGDMGLISAPEPDKPAAKTSLPSAEPIPEPSTTIPEYSREDVMNKLESDGSFSSLLREVERKLGKLSEPSVKKLLGLYDFLGLPAEVIFLLVGYCADLKAEQFGAGKPPTMREIEKEGYAWARRELFSIDAADEFIKKERKKRGRFTEYMDALQLGGRQPSPGEERYIGSWIEMGFQPDAIAIAYDKTVLRCHELKWPYLNGILKRWHEKGIHTPQDIERETLGAKKQGAQKVEDPNAWMNDYD